MIKVCPELHLIASVRGHAWPGFEPPLNLHVEATVSFVKVYMIPGRRPSIWSDPIVIANLDEDAADKERRVNDGRSARVVDVGKNCVIAMRAAGKAQRQTGVSQRKRRRTAAKVRVCLHPYLELLHHLVIAERDQTELDVRSCFPALPKVARCRSSAAADVCARAGPALNVASAATQARSIYANRGCADIKVVMLMLL